MTKGGKAMLIMLDFIVPFIFIGIGLFLLLFPNIKIGTNGYRSTFSKKSRHVWEYAQKITPIICIKAGFLQAIVIIITRMLPLPLSNRTIQIIINSYPLIASILMVVIIEKDIKRHFDQNGNPK